MGSGRVLYRTQKIRHFRVTAKIPGPIFQHLFDTAGLCACSPERTAGPFPSGGRTPRGGRHACTEFPHGPHAFSAATDLWPGFRTRRPDNPSPQKTDDPFAPASGFPASPAPPRGCSRSGTTELRLLLRPTFHIFACRYGNKHIPHPAAAFHASVPVWPRASAAPSPSPATPTNGYAFARTVGRGADDLRVARRAARLRAETALAARGPASTHGRGSLPRAFAGSILLIGIIDRPVPSFGRTRTKARAMPGVRWTAKPKNAAPDAHGGDDGARHHDPTTSPRAHATFTTALETARFGVAIAADRGHIHSIPGRHRRVDPHILRHGNRAKRAFTHCCFPLRPGRATLSFARCWHGAEVLTPSCRPRSAGCVLAGVAGIMVFIRSTSFAPCGARIRRGARGDLRRGERHGGHGREPAAARLRGCAADGGDAAAA